MISHLELKQLRREIGATVSRMAELLGLSGDNASDTVRKMENGSKPISGPIERIAKFMQEGVAEGNMSQVLPQFMLSTDLLDEIKVEYVFHTRYPRFLAAVTPAPVKDLCCSTTDGIEWLSVCMWIDEPVSDPQSFVDEAARQFAIYTQESMR